MTTVYRSRAVDSMIATVANSLLRESGINCPTTPHETEEVQRLAERGFGPQQQPFTGILRGRCDQLVRAQRIAGHGDFFE